MRKTKVTYFGEVFKDFNHSKILIIRANLTFTIKSNPRSKLGNIAAFVENLNFENLAVRSQAYHTTNSSEKVCYLLGEKHLS